MNIPAARNALADLYRLVEAGEKGYAVVSVNVNNRALKILYRFYAQQRLTFKEEILTELRRLGVHKKPRSHFLGLLHRGRIDIFADLTIGDENVEKLLQEEILFGETAALRAYEKTLKTNLPRASREIIQRQFDEVRNVVEQARLMMGRDGQRLLLCLYESKEAAEQARQALTSAGVSDVAIELKSWDQTIPLYQGRGTTMLETIITGSVGGAGLGLIGGLLAAIGITQLLDFGSQVTAPAILLLAIFGLTAAIAFVGGMIGLFIGWGISSGDKFIYADTIQHGEILMRANVDISRASRAWHIMKQVATQARVQRIGEHSAELELLKS